MNFEIVHLGNFNGNKAGIYTVFLPDEQTTLFERFIKENNNSFKDEIRDILGRIQAINQKTGARESFFKLDEGIPGDGICALYDKPNSKLRIYCIRYGASLIILGGGGPKSTRSLQQDQKLKSENYLLREISALITERIREEEIRFVGQGSKLLGNLKFYNHEHEE